MKWQDIELLFVELGAEITEAEGSRVCVWLFGDRRVFYRPHLSPDTDKGAVSSVRSWLDLNGGADFYASDIKGLYAEGLTSLAVFLKMCEEYGVAPKKLLW